MGNGPKVGFVAMLLLCELFPVGFVFAQTTFINPNGVGGYTIITPGQRNGMTFVNPNGIGGFTAITPGARNGTTFINPDGVGGFTVFTPGQNSAFGHGSHLPSLLDDDE
jgi:predicted RNA-binding protein with TRAM domain